MEKYKITKSLRFKLLPEKIQETRNQTEILKNNTNEEAKRNNLWKLILRGQDLPPLFDQYTRHKDNHKLKSNIEIHNRWLRLYTKDLFYNWKKEDTKKKIKLSDIDYLSPVLEDFLNEWKIIIERIYADYSRPEESKTRDADVAFSIRKLGTRHIFPFVKKFVADSDGENTEETKSKLTALLSEFETALKICEKNYLPAQSSGIVIARASFNYYTVNKKQKKFDDDINKLKNQSESVLRKYSQLISELKIDNLAGKSLGEKVLAIKYYRASKKKQFMEDVANGLPHRDLESKYPLFQIDRNKYDKFLTLTRKITELGSQKSVLSKGSDAEQKITKSIIDLRKQRGAFFAERGKSPKFEKHLQLVQLIKKLGSAYSKLKGIEKERIDSERLECWALVLEENQRHSLILIPKAGASGVYKKVKAMSTKSASADSSLYYFESLTYRALRKLCFGVNGNTFLPEIQKELPQYDQREFGEFCFHKEGSDKEIDEPRLISFYQSVLRTDYVKNNLVLPQSAIDEVAGLPFQTIPEFKIAMEKCCYMKKQIISAALKKEILDKDDTQIFQISSLDLEKTVQKNLKAHTQIWHRFWTKENEKDNYSLRLNPEIAIAWREAKKTRIEKYGKGSALYDPQKKNRYLHEQYTLCTTVTDNALHNEITFAFEDTKKKDEAIRQFNDKINRSLKERMNEDQLWFYGIDTGEKEFATLSLIDKNKKPQLFTAYEFKELDFLRQGYIYNNKHELVLRDKPYKAIQNLSYFLNEELYEKTFRDGKFQETFAMLFSEKKVSALDLTTAKVINGKIILNGDYITLLNLKIQNAKRKIYKELIRNPQAQLQEDNYKLYFARDGKAEYIYQSWEKFENIKPYREIKDDLFVYFNNQQKNEARVEEQINQMRRALVGNMTGVIHFLYQQYPGVIAIENLSHSNIESHREKFEAYIERPLQWGLYRKFQQEGLVPPISELIKLREIEDNVQKKSKQEQEKGLMQFGIIKFVSEAGTSLSCPFCGKKAYPSGNDKKYIEDKKTKIFECVLCGFHNQTNPLEYESLDSNDKVAAFNIAKRGFADMQKSA